MGKCIFLVCFWKKEVIEGKWVKIKLGCVELLYWGWKELILNVLDKRVW